MIRIAVTEAAFEAIAATLPLASEPEVDAMGERVLWVDQAVADRLSAMREPGESSSDVILRLVLRLVTAERRRADFKSYSRPTVSADGQGPMPTVTAAVSDEMLAVPLAVVASCHEQPVSIF